ncbi:MAG: hypothetical protein EXS36_04795 [Pedosphaera sp.]|nr:hypothetical protein [Pedosphaera sp.]
MKILQMRTGSTRAVLASLAIGVRLAVSAAADVPHLTIQVLSGQVEITAHGITGDQVTLDVSADLTSWATLSGVVLSKGARAKAKDFPGWSIPISKNGSITFHESVLPNGAPRFYRTFSPGRGWEDARQRWAALNVREYRYKFQRFCFCFGPPGEGIVHVKDGRVVDVVELSSPRVPPGPVAGDPALYPTIEGLFGFLDQFVKEGADVIQFRVDPTTGIPALISVDRLLGAIDDEISYTATKFQRIQ